MTVGYDPERVRFLASQTRASLDALDSLRSTDPSAAEAMRTVRLLRRHLEDHWMPALMDIQRSDAMVSWTRAGLELPWWVGSRPATDLLLPAHLRPPPIHASALSVASNDEFAGLLEHTDRLLLTTDPPDDLDPLAAELARRVAGDRAFADRITEMAASTPLIGFLTGRTDFPIPFVKNVVRSMMWPEGRATTVELDHYAESLSTAVAALVGNPSACLDLLVDPLVLHGIGSWDRLDADAVTEFVVSGLHTAVLADPNRLTDGYRALASLTAMVNGPLDRGIHPAMAAGVAASMVGYIESLAPAIRQEGAYPVLVVRQGLEVELGTYDDLVDLFGALLRDAEAQAALGIVLGGYTATIVTGLGAAVGTRPGLEYVTRFADLISDASRTEQAELVMQAAAEEARRRQVGTMIGFGATAALAAAGVGSAARAVVTRGISLAANYVAPVQPAKLPDARIPSATYDLITVEVLAVVSSDRTVRARAGLGSVAAADWRELRRRLDDIDDETDPDERTKKILRIDHWIEAEVPLVASYLGQARAVPGMDELTEGRNAVGAD